MRGRKLRGRKWDAVVCGGKDWRVSRSLLELLQVLQVGSRVRAEERVASSPLSLQQTTSCSPTIAVG
jgi:hypothetical protein